MSEFHAFEVTARTPLDDGTYEYALAQVAPDFGSAGGYVEAVPSLEVTAYEANNALVEVGSVVAARFKHTSGGHPVYEFFDGAGSARVIVKVTSATVDADGNYPALTTRWDTADEVWADGETVVKLKAANGETLVSDNRYLAVPAGPNADEEQVYVMDGGATVATGIPGTTAFVTVGVDDGENAPYFSGQVTEYQESGYLAGTWQLTTPVWIVGRSATAGDPGSYTTPVYTQRYLAVIGPDHTIDGDTRPRAWIEDQHGPYYRGGIRPNAGATPGDMLHGSYNVEGVLQATQMVARTNWTGATPVDARFVAHHVAEDGESYWYTLHATGASCGWEHYASPGARRNKLGWGFQKIGEDTVDQEHFFIVAASYYDPTLEDDVYCRAGYAVADESEMPWYGVWGTLEDGSEVKGGIITSIGSGGSDDMDYGTW